VSSSPTRESASSKLSIPRLVRPGGKRASSQLRILLLSSEVAPFAKTGGLADVAGALPKELQALGHDVRVMLPKYAVVRERGFNFRDASGLKQVRVDMGRRKYVVSFKSAFLPDSSVTASSPQQRKSGPQSRQGKGKRKGSHSPVPVYFLEYDPFYNRDSLYLDPSSGKDWMDNPERFTLFCRAALAAVKTMDWQPDIIHCNDWQTAFVPYLLKSERAGDPFFQNTRTLLSIHNLAYQGNFDPRVLGSIGVPKEYFQPMGPFEFYGKFSFLKVGLIYADLLNTVSENYAREIQSSPEFGVGLEGILTARTKDLFGIINGLDVDVWNPETDPRIPANFGKSDLSSKAVCKKELCKKCGLPYSPDTPVIGIISRLAAQKGFDLLENIIDQLFKLDIQLVLLGTGEERYHKLFKKISRKYPSKTSIHLTFDDALAHWIEAGSDMFLMPSKYEPCGLNQMMSMRYGTVPVVRKTGGLADTVKDVDEHENGNGFVFKNYDRKELLDAIGRAVDRFSNKRAWKKIMLSGMIRDFSWEASARKYVTLYEKALNRNR